MVVALLLHRAGHDAHYHCRNCPHGESLRGQATLRGDVVHGFPLLCLADGLVRSHLDFVLESTHRCVRGYRLVMGLLSALALTIHTSHMYSVHGCLFVNA